MDKRWIGAAAALLILLATGVWATGWFAPAEDPLIVQARIAMETPREERTKEEQNALGDAWRDRMKGMNEDQRQAFMEAMAPIFIPLMMKHFEARFDKFMAMSPAEQRKELDKEIDKVQKRMAASGGQGGFGGGGGGGGRAPRDPAKAVEFQKKMLAYVTPEQSSKFQAGMMMFTNRMKERGLTPPPMQGGGFF